MTRHDASGNRGYTMLELLLVVGIGTVLTAMSVPAVMGARQRFELRSAAHDVGSALQAARLRSVSTGRTLRMRFNCPAAAQYRVVMVTNNAGIDGAANRCDPVAFPPADLNAAAGANLDGPLRTLRGGVTFDGPRDLEITPTGRMTPLAGATPVTITVVNQNARQSLVVSVAGRISFP